MSSRRPTPAQMRALERLAKGDVIRDAGFGPASDFFFSDDLAGIHGGTVHAMRAAGWIEQFGSRVRPSYRITPAGRRAFEENRDA